MPRFADYRAIERFYGHHFRRPVRVSVSASPSRIAEKLRARAACDPVQITFPRAPIFERNLQMVLQQNRFSAPPNQKTIRLGPEDLYRAACDFDPYVGLDAPIYHRVPMATRSEGATAIARFARAYLGLTEATADDLNVPSFPIVGPLKNLFMGVRGERRISSMGFRDVDVPDGVFNFVHPVRDNLVALQFQLIQVDEMQGTDKNHIRKRYAFDKSVRSLFSEYDYAEEEERQFHIFQQHLLTESERRYQQAGLDALRAFLQNPTAWPSISFKMAGPLRRLRLRIPPRDAQTAETIAMLDWLHLEPNVVYTVETFWEKREGEMGLPALKFSPRSGRGGSITYYYLPDYELHHILKKDAPGSHDFTPVAPATMDEKGRVVVPPHFRPRPWDDDTSRGLVL